MTIKNITKQCHGEEASISQEANLATKGPSKYSKYNKQVLNRQGFFSRPRYINDWYMKSIFLALALSLSTTNIKAQSDPDNLLWQGGQMSGHFHAICYGYALADTSKDKIPAEIFLDSFIQNWMNEPEIARVKQIVVKDTIKSFRNYSHTESKEIRIRCANALEKQTRGY